MLSEFVILAAGDWVIQNAANSGVGGYLMQLAKRRGLRTVNLVRRESAVGVTKAQRGDVVLVDGEDIVQLFSPARATASLGHVRSRAPATAIQARGPPADAQQALQLT